MIDEDKVKKVALEQDRILITPVEEEKQSGIAGVSYTYYTGYVNDDTLVPLLKRKGIEFEGYIPDSSSSIVEFLLAYVLPFLFIYIIFAFVYRRIAKKRESYKCYNCRYNNEYYKVNILWLLVIIVAITIIVAVIVIIITIVITVVVIIIHTLLLI